MQSRLDDEAVPIVFQADHPATSSALQDGILSIGDVTVPVKAPKNPALIPHTVFYSVPAHTRLLRAMLQNFSIGEHLLLIGNQGVGKNKLTDRLLQLLQRERGYIQLHRDTTVQSLTLTPTFRNGEVCWDDSPLVLAVTLGHVLVIDEADKAPNEVVCVLKSLVEDGGKQCANI